MFANPPDDELRALLARIRTIAIVGLSPNPDRPSHQVAAAMQGFGYRIIPVHPAAREILGVPVCPSLAALPCPVDLVDVFRASEFVEGIIDECLAIGAPAVWLQQGIVNEPAAWRAQAAGLTVVMDRCLYRETVRLCGAAPCSGA